MPRHAASSKGLRGSSVRREAGDGAPVDVRGVMPLTRRPWPSRRAPALARSRPPPGRARGAPRPAPRRRSGGGPRPRDERVRGRRCLGGGATTSRRESAAAGGRRAGRRRDREARKVIPPTSGMLTWRSAHAQRGRRGRRGTRGPMTTIGRGRARGRARCQACVSIWEAARRSTPSSRRGDESFGRGHTPRRGPPRRAARRRVARRQGVACPSGRTRGRTKISCAVTSEGRRARPISGSESSVGFGGAGYIASVCPAAAWASRAVARRRP